MHDKDNQPTVTDHDRDIRLSADALGQLDDRQRQLLEVDLQTDEDLRSCHEDLLRVADALSRQHAAEAIPATSLELRRAIQARLDGEVRLPDKPAKPAGGNARRSRRRVVVTFAVSACLLVLLAIPISHAWRRQVTRQLVLVRTQPKPQQMRGGVVDPDVLNLSVAAEGEFFDRGRSESILIDQQSKQDNQQKPTIDVTEFAITESVVDYDAATTLQMAEVSPTNPPAPVERFRFVVPKVPQPPVEEAKHPGSTGGYPGGATTGLGGYGVVSGAGGIPAQPQGITPQGGTTTLETLDVKAQPGSAPKGDPRSQWSAASLHKATVAGGSMAGESQVRRQELTSERSERDGWYFKAPQPPTSREQYATIVENPFVPVSQQPLSTLSIDVDTASYANVRRFLTQNQLPPANAVRIEELVNYFSYDYPAPQDDQPFASHMEVTECPWQPDHRLVRVGLQGKTIERPERPGCNLVFLLDVSGSMKDSNKLPLLKQAMKLLVDQLDENDRVAIVTYASQAGVRLKSTVADKHDVIRDAINGLNANGSTNGGAGIQMAYEQALAGALEGGVNRVILATDGDLNVGITDDDALVRLIKEKAASDVFLTVLGFGEGNLQDAKLEKLADNGNGLYAYIDNLSEARKVLVEQIEGSLVTIAKDVKIKVEFNPAEVQAYRLIGYENRLMTAAEFDDDKKDAGEIGAGHSVTALYEIVPAAPAQLASAESLKYQQPATPVVPEEQLTDAAKTGELLTLSLRYKLPDADESTLVEVPLLNVRKRFSDASLDFRFATAVASFGMLLRDSVHRGDTSFAAVEEIAAAAMGNDEKGYRTEFLDLVRRAATLK